ncbi:XdhC family protein [Microbulbifer agarilyticus]|uniref:XdhC family protein n=1 Tax=Microbulbifer agarilyticus TaxID=260552 RepID=UPI001C97A954|nr:XdhC/CoxI family protein [Microbulbifer agarilyticus]MBY6212015.1 XdhC family protein [Microbulbifer agarilyticus]
MQDLHGAPANHLGTLLDLWFQNRDSRGWVLGTVYRTQGPSYRKAGSMMLCDDLGRHYGLLSGGCLESDIQRHALKTLRTGKAATIRYDGNDEDDVAFQLGIGCGGEVEILLQPITPENNYLQLAELRSRLRQRQPMVFRQQVATSGEARAELRPLCAGALGVDIPLQRPVLAENDGALWLNTPLLPAPHVLIVGGGIDARPMAQQFNAQGWLVSLCDPRPANARPAYFPNCTSYRCHPDALPEKLDLDSIDAAIAMSHNLNLDAAAIRLLHQRPLRYLGLLGPISRRNQVLTLSGLPTSEQEKLIHSVLRAPIGLDLGGELPESIALATCAEIHSVLHRKSAAALTAQSSQARPEVCSNAALPE